MSAQEKEKCPECGSIYRNERVLVGYAPDMRSPHFSRPVYCADPWHSAPPAEPARCKFCKQPIAHEKQVCPNIQSDGWCREGQEASPQEALQAAKEWAHKKLGLMGEWSPNWQITLFTLGELLVAYAADERKLRLAAEEENRNLRDSLEAERAKVSQRNHVIVEKGEANMSLHLKLAAAESRLAQIEKERSGK